MSVQGAAVDLLEEGGAVGVGDGEGNGADVDAVAFNHGDFVQIDDVGAVDAEERQGEGFFEVFHVERGDDGDGLGGEVDFHVVLHAFNVEDVVECEAYQFVARADKGVGAVVRGGRGCAWLLESVERFLGGAEEFGVADGFEEVVDGVYLEAFHGILFEGGGEDDLCLSAD